MSNKRIDIEKTEYRDRASDRKSSGPELPPIVKWIWIAAIILLVAWGVSGVIQ